MKNKLLVLALIVFQTVKAQSAEPSSTKVLSLNQAIEVAADSSLASFKAKNLYLSGYWQFRTFKAERLPSLTLDMNPLQYNRNFVKRYDSQNDVDVYKSQQSLYSSANLSIKQNLDLTGGTFYIDTELGYLRNFGLSRQDQYSSVPFRLGYSQSLFGFNSFKWEKRIEPLHYEKVKKELLYNLEGISEQTSTYFFDLALSQTIYDLAQRNVMNSDTLYKIGLERHKIGSISKAELLTLKLDALNAKNDFSNAQIDLKRSSFALATFLRYDTQTQFRLLLPERPLEVFISAEEALNRAKENNPQIPELKENILTAQQNLEKSKKASRFSASLSASVGFNQVATSLSDAYRRPLQQDVVAVSLSVPVLDWGVRKGKVNMARNNLNSVNISSKQSEQSFEQDVIMTVNDFNVRQSLIQSAEEAKKIAELAYDETRQRFMIGKTDVNGLNLSLNRQTEAQRNYITALKNYWLSYYKIRKLTLYDFVGNKPVSAEFEQIQGF